MLSNQINQEILKVHHQQKMKDVYTMDATVVLKINSPIMLEYFVVSARFYKPQRLAKRRIVLCKIQFEIRKTIDRELHLYFNSK